MQNDVVSWIVPALRYEIFNLRVLTGNKQQLEVSKERVFSNRQKRSFPNYVRVVSDRTGLVAALQACML